MSIAQFLSIVRARWRIGLMVWVLTVAVAVAVSLFQHKQYTAASSVVIDVKPDPVAAMAFPAAQSAT